MKGGGSCSADIRIWTMWNKNRVRSGVAMEIGIEMGLKAMVNIVAV
jgi:hypothetical protein